MERFFLERWVERVFSFDKKFVATWSACRTTQPQGSRGGCSSLLCSEEEEAVDCVLRVASRP